jgi:hypothetical protein
MEKLDKNKLILPIAIVLGCLILGGVFYMIQINKQKSIERQQEIKIEAERQAQKDRENKLSVCLGDAVSAYNVNWEAGCKFQGKTEKNCVLYGSVADDINSTLEEAKTDCYKTYK